MIVDQLRTPLSIIVTNGTKSDYPNLIELFNGIMVDTVNMDTNNKILLADSSYEGLYNNYTISEKGYDVYMGYNKRSQKNIVSNKATKNEIEMTYIKG